VGRLVLAVAASHNRRIIRLRLTGRALVLVLLGRAAMRQLDTGRDKFYECP